MYEKVLDVKHFPGASFASREITVRGAAADLFEAHVAGELSFHGVARELGIDAQVSRVGTALRISGGFLLRQSGYGIKPISFAAGALRLKDDLKYKFELLAQKTE